MQEKPFSQACENNKDPILSVLSRVFVETRNVLEIGSGTGQHAVYFAENLSHVNWIPSDREENLDGISAWLKEYQGSNLGPLMTFDVQQTPWPAKQADAVFSANTAHIMPWATTKLMLNKVAEHLPQDGLFALYGPFNYQGKFTSESNARFDEWLKHIDSSQGIRDFESMDEIAHSKGLNLLEDNVMPANNHLIVWRKS